MPSPDRPRRPTFAYLCASLHTGSGPEVWKGVEEAAEALDVHVVAFPGGRLGGRDDFESLRNRIFSLPGAPAIDGVLSWASSLSGVRGATEAAALHARFDGLPLVTLSDPLPGRPCVRVDVASGMGTLVDHLVEVHGYRDFAFVRGPEAHLSAQIRYEAFRSSLVRHGLACRDELITTPRGWDQGREALAELIDHRNRVPGRDFTALVAASDLLAFSLLRDLQTRGYRVPSDTAVVGFNDSSESRIVNPPLTTVHLPFRAQASEGLRTLYNLWKGQEVTTDSLLPTRLVLRQSCSCRSQELERAVGPGDPDFADLGFTRSEVQAWIEPLEAALSLAPPQRDRRFLDLLERVLERMNSTRFAASVWQTVLSELRRGCDLDRGLEDLFGQARILVAEASVREFSFRQWQRDQKAEQVRGLARSLQGALDPRRLSQILTRKLPDLGFRSGWLVRHETDSQADRALLLGCFTERGLELPPGGLDFPLATLLPPGTLPDRRRTLVVEPLFYREHSLGYLVLEASGVGPEVYEELRAAVSTALKTALLLDANRPPTQRIFDPLSVLGACVPVLPRGFDRLPYCLGEPDSLVQSLDNACVDAPRARVRLEGSTLRVDIESTPFSFQLPTLGGEVADLEGDRMVIFSQGPLEPGLVDALEEATALGALVVDPDAVAFESFATLVPPLAVIDLDEVGEATLRTLLLLANDPRWRAVPFVAFPPRHRTLGQARTLVELLPAARPRTEGVRVLFVGVPLPEVDHPGLDFRQVPSGLQAIPLLQQDPADLVVVSSGGPGFRGLDLVEYLGSDPSWAGLKVLVLVEGNLRPQEWERLETSRVTVQIQGLWSPRELVDFLGAFARRPGEPSSRVKRALAWLVEHHAQEVARWRLAEHLAISEDHLTRDFRRELGQTPWDFLTRYRVCQAKRALVATDKRLADVARDVGYHDQSYFCRVFRKETGTTPQRYRDITPRLG